MGTELALGFAGREHGPEQEADTGGQMSGSVSIRRVTKDPIACQQAGGRAGTARRRADSH